MRILRLDGWLVYFVLLFSLPAHAVDPDWRSPVTVEGAISTSPQEAKALYDAGVPFIDVRNARLHSKQHIPGDHHLELKKGFTEEALKAIASHDDPIVIYCSGVKCSRSYRASEKAVTWGYKKVHYFRGGIVDWREAGYPTESLTNR